MYDNRIIVVFYFSVLKYHGGLLCKCYPRMRPQKYMYYVCRKTSIRFPVTCNAESDESIVRLPRAISKKKKKCWTSKMFSIKGKVMNFSIFLLKYMFFIGQVD